MIRLVGESSDIESLSKALAPSGPSRIDWEPSTGAYYLRSALLDGIDDPRSAFDAGAALLGALTASGLVIHGHSFNVRADGLGRENLGHPFDQFVFPESILWFDPSVTKNSERTATMVTMEEAAELALKQPEVAKALRIFLSDRSWVGLYKVFELIRADAGGSMFALGWTTKAEVGHFTHTANSPAASGDDARHGVLPGDPPAMPMRRDDAVQLIERLLQRWLEYLTQRTRPLHS
jgi:hypothetical protein